MDTIPIDSDDMISRLHSSNPIYPHNCASGFGLETTKFTYVSKGIPIRLELASRFAATLVGKMDTLDILHKSFALADALIEKYNKDLNEPGQH